MKPMFWIILALLVWAYIKHGPEPQMGLEARKVVIETYMFPGR
jgi:hypothetical protein